MIRKIFLPLTVLMVVGIGVFVYRESQQKAVVSNVLSDRAKSYIDKQSKTTGSDWRYSSVGKEEQKVAENITETIDNCFTITIPFAVKTARKDGECEYYYQLAKPKGSITVYQRTESITSPDQMPGISMRRQSSHTYTEQALDAGGKKFILFKNKDVSGYEANAYYYKGGGTYIILNVQAYTSENLDPKLQVMLGSIRFK